MGPAGQSELPIEEEQFLDRNEIIRRLSQSVLALSSNNPTRITDEDSPAGASNPAATRQSDDIAAAGRKASGSIPAGAASERYDIEEPDRSDGANDAPSSAQQRSLNRGQALTQVTHLAHTTTAWHSNLFHACTGT